MTALASGRGAAHVAPRAPSSVTLAVVAAHRTGLPLHGELLDLGACSEGVAWTAPVYRLVALPGPGVARGGLVASPTGGASIEVELHRMPTAALGALLCGLPAPLAVGRVELEAGSTLGLLCVSVPAGAVDISECGSWPAYLATLAGDRRLPSVDHGERVAVGDPRAALGP